MWIESNTSLSRNRKFKKFRRSLDISIKESLGILHLLWHHVMELAEDGNITKWDAEDIADYCDYSGDPEKLYKALLNNGFIDIKNNRKIVHDWWEHSKHYLTNRYRTNNLSKLNEIRSLHGQTKLKPKSDQSMPTNLTNQPNQPNQPTLEEIRCLYEELKGWSKSKLPSYHYARSNKAIKQLMVLADKDKELVKDGLRWIAEQGYEWTLETLDKKWPDFVKKGAKSKAYKDMEKLSAK